MCFQKLCLYANINNLMARVHSKSISPEYHRFLTPPPPCHTLSPFALTSLPPCHHPNSDKLFNPKLAEKFLGLCLAEHIRMPKSHTEWQQKSRINKKTMFLCLKPLIQSSAKVKSSRSQSISENIIIDMNNLHI